LKAKYNFALLACLLAVGLATGGCRVINELRAKDTLNQGVQEYNDGKYEAAQAKFAEALKLDGKMVNAQLFHAHTLKAQFDQNASEDLGLEAIKEYDKIIADNQGNEKVIDQALGFKIKIYESLARNAGTTDKDKQLRYVEDQRAGMLKRAENSTNNEVKASTHHALAASYWDESYYGNSQQYTTYNRPIPPDIQKKMEPLIEKGLTHIEESLKLNSDPPDAWVFKRLLLYEKLKIENNPENKKVLEARIKETGDMYEKKRKEQQDKQATEGTQATSQ
jgi:tetratricopeptide (TPR) repeat protein